MIRIVVASDECNSTHGQYFEASKEYLSSLVDGQEWENELHVMGSNDCKRSYVSTNLPMICADNPFVFVVFSHGNEKACVAGGANYVDASNAKNFCKSLFYSTACLNGRELGENLVKEGCSAFIGFTEESNAFTEENHQDVFMRCDLACLFSFLGNKDKMLSEAFKEAIAYYNTQIDRLDSFQDLILKGLLIENRNALTLLGNKELKREDLEF